MSVLPAPALSTHWNASLRPGAFVNRSATALEIVASINRVGL
jgi:hypothetical protein